MNKLSMLVLIAGFGAASALSGCAITGEYGSAGRQALKNAEGHVIGYRELLRSKDSGEVFAQMNFFKPVHNTAGEVIGYEEETRDGAVGSYAPPGPATASA